MKQVFADTFYFVALLDPGDAHHRRVEDYSETHQPLVVTTCWVLAETANALAGGRFRVRTATFLALLHHNSRTVIIKDSDALYDRGLALYAKRPDKGWSLTDCISFVVMAERAIFEALTGDRHFEQAGFAAVFAV